MKKLIPITTLILCLASFAETYPESGDRVRIGDMTYVLVRDGDWAGVTSTVARVTAMYASMNATESGRVMLHGKRGHTTITNGTITVEYADGYKATEAIRRGERPKAKITRSATEQTAHVRRPDRLETLLRQREAMKIAKPREVTVEVKGGAK